MPYFLEKILFTKAYYIRIQFHLVVETIPFFRKISGILLIESLLGSLNYENFAGQYIVI